MRRKLYPRNTEFTVARAEAIRRALSGEERIEIGEFDVKLSGPEYGWLYIDFYINGNRVFHFIPSDVYPPFSLLRDWLEHMIHFVNYPSSSFIIDCESYDSYFSYDFLGDARIKGIYEPVALIQLADNTDSENSDGIVHFIIPIRKFVSCLYGTIKDYMCENRQLFSENWDLPGGGEFEIQKLMDTFVSKDIEDELADMEKYSGDLGHWPLIQIK